MINPNIFKTIRFRLTLWYSLLLILLSLILIVSINLAITRHYRKDPQDFPPPPYLKSQTKQQWAELIEKKELIQEYRRRDLDKVRQVSVLSFIPLTLLSFGGGYLIAGQMLNPLKKLNKATSEITAKDLNKKIKHEDTGDEISALINNFNNMTSRLNHSFESQKEFVENASHELKTPLAIIQTNLDSALSDKKISNKELISIIQITKNSTKFMDKLVEDLLLLSILENNVAKEKLYLDKILKKAVKKCEVIARKKNIKIILKVTNADKSFLQGNDILLQRAFMNIIENAVKYSPKNKKVDISLKKSSSSFIISIEDQGTGIPKKEQARIFDRFYRVDKSRTRKSGGTGLGLSITKKIINLHKGEISIKSQMRKGSTFTIQFPQ